MVRSRVGTPASTVQEGADATVRLAAEPDLDVQGRYFDGLAGGPRRRDGLRRGRPQAALGRLRAARRLTRAVVITGGPGTGKSSVAQAFTTLLENAGIEHGAIESEQLAWGHAVAGRRARPRAARARCCGCSAATGGGCSSSSPRPRRRPTSTPCSPRSGRSGRSWRACARRARSRAARVLAREPERWAGRDALAAHARELAEAIPRAAGRRSRARHRRPRRGGRGRGAVRGVRQRRWVGRG